MITINLQQYRIPNSKILFGRDFGAKVREKLKLDKIDKTEGQIKKCALSWGRKIP